MKRTQSFYVPTVAKRSRTLSVKSSRPGLASSAGANLSYSSDGSRRKGSFKIDAKTKVKGVSSILRKAIQAVMDTRVERKQIINQLGGGNTITALTTGVATAPAFYSLLPTLTQGTAQGLRVGNQIRVMDSKLSYRIALPIGQTNMQTFYMTVWVACLKGNAQQAPGLVDWTKLLHQSNTVEAGEYTQDCSTALLPINEEWWNVKSRRTYKVGPSNMGTSGGECNDSKAYFEDSFDIPYLNGLLNYEDNSNLPQNKNLYFFVTIMNASLSITLPTVFPYIIANYTASFVDA